MQNILNKSHACKNCRQNYNNHISIVSLCKKKIQMNYYAYNLMVYVNQVNKYQKGYNKKFRFG